MQVLGFYYMESFSPVAKDMLTIIMIGLNLFHEEERWFAELCGVEA